MAPLRCIGAIKLVFIAALEISLDQTMHTLLALNMGAMAAKKKKKLQHCNICGSQNGMLISAIITGSDHHYRRSTTGF
ncbi:hypothetical protein BDW67DRAFT_165841, partial [Aspergillus spinulosporus]